MATASTTPADGAPARIRAWPRWARLLTVLIGGAAELSLHGIGPLRVAVTAALFAHALFRAVVAPSGRTGVVLDVVVGTVVVAMTGGVSSNFAGFALIVAFEAGMDLGVPSGAAAGSVVALGCLPAAYGDIATGAGDPRALAGALALYPLTAISGMLLTRFSRNEQRERSILLAQAHGVLSTLYRIAPAVPGGFERRHVAEAVLDEARTALGAPAAAVVAGTASPIVLASYGMPDLAPGTVLDDGDVRVLRELPVPVVRPSTALPRALRDPASAYGRWIAAPIRHHGRSLGIVLVATDGTAIDDEAVVVQRLGEEAGVGLENARLFERVQELSADSERKRIARELHDGVAQALAHVHFELGFLSRHGSDPEQLRDEAGRLARVVARALGDVRGTISGLRDPLEGGLAGAIDAFVRDLRGAAGPTIELRSSGAGRVPDVVAAEVFRIVQEAVSNALRHAGAERIDVTLERSPDALRVGVRDDGSGIPPGSSPGVGLVAMHERARKINADLTIETEPSRGVTVSLRWRAPRPARTTVNEEATTPS